MFAAVLAQVTHVQCEFAIAVYAAALQPGPLAQARQPLIVLVPWAQCRYGRGASNTIACHTPAWGREESGFLLLLLAANRSML